MLTRTISLRISNQSRSRHQKINLPNQGTNEERKKERRSLCRKRRWKRKERGNKKLGLWWNTSISSRTTSGKRILGFWSRKTDMVTPCVSICLDQMVLGANVLGHSPSAPAAYQATSFSLLQLLHLQIMVNVSHTGHLSWAGTVLGPTTNIRSTIHAVEYAQPSFCS